MGAEYRPIVALRILVLDPNAREGEVIQQWLTPHGHCAVLKTTIPQALEEAVTHAFDIVILCWRLGSAQQLEVVKHLRRESPWTQIVIVCPSIDSMQATTDAIGSGDAELVMRPITRPQAEFIVRTAAGRLRLRRNTEAMRVTMDRRTPSSWVSGSPAAQQAIDLAKQLASSRASVLLCGEPGTGKRCLGRMIHDWSPRADGPFVAMHCRTESPDLFEAELFGGGDSPSGTSAELSGFVALCEHGTLLLEEVGLLPKSLQPRLLQLLRSQEYERRGDWRMRQADVRIIATSSIDLAEVVKRGLLCPELMATLESIRIDLPPLRERREDIIPLANAYLKFYAHEADRKAGTLAPEAMDALQEYSWPGNLRELHNVMERAVISGESAVIGLGHLPLDLRSAPAVVAGTVATSVASGVDTTRVAAARRADVVVADARTHLVGPRHNRRHLRPKKADHAPDPNWRDDSGPRNREAQTAA